jgi:hypothetical protein
MDEATEKLFKGFVDFCEELIDKSYVITDGRRVLMATLDHGLATKICKLTIKNSGDDRWKVASLPAVAELAYRTGYEDAQIAFKQAHLSEEKENPSES